MLVVICSRLVEGLCSPGIEGCVYVDGPQNATVKYATELPSGLQTRFKLQISWPVSQHSCSTWHLPSADLALFTLQSSAHHDSFCKYKESR